MKIQANQSGTRSIEVSDAHFQTIDRYSLFDNLIDSNLLIEERTVEKLKANVRALLGTEAGQDKALLDLCLDVIYSNNMKAIALQNLAEAYKEWKKNKTEEA